MTAERRDGIDDHQRVVLACNRGKLSDRIEDARRRLRMYQRHDVDRRSRKRMTQLVRVACAPPLNVQPRDGRAVSLTNLRQSITEVTGDDHEYPGARLYEIGDNGLHP